MTKKIAIYGHRTYVSRLDLQNRGNADGKPPRSPARRRYWPQTPARQDWPAKTVRLIVPLRPGRTPRSRR